MAPGWRLEVYTLVAEQQLYQREVAVVTGRHECRVPVRVGLVRLRAIVASSSFTAATCPCAPQS